uniref:Teichoic acid biosynthesis protein n=1 Tax=Candidatus Kentrum sp. FW TaxID=2126338 RepID=A0A450U436_9GAMM|nr:MAG: conserved hypothetical protein [Candidatus Kentron sp. FW]
MSVIFYSMAGEGRGHASKVRAITNALRTHGHRLHLFAPAMAYDFLEPLYRHSNDVQVTRIPGIVYHYTAKGQVAYGLTGWHMLRYWATRPRWSRAITKAFQDERPDFVIVDFEPELPRQAKRFHVPWISIDHVNFLRTYDLSMLPLSLRVHTWWWRLVVAAYGGGKTPHCIVSSFYFPPLRPGMHNVVQVGGILHENVRRACPTDAGHVTAYLRRGMDDNVLRSLAECGREVHIFSEGKTMQKGNLHFHPIDPEKFIESMVHCSALIATAGNQVISEALYLGSGLIKEIQ